MLVGSKIAVGRTFRGTQDRPARNRSGFDSFTLGVVRRDLGRFGQQGRIFGTKDLGAKSHRGIHLRLTVSAFRRGRDA